MTALVLPGLTHPLVVSLPFLFGRITGQHGLARLIESETVRERVWLGLALPDASTAHECIKAHRFTSDSIACPVHSDCRHSRARAPAPRSPYAVRIDEYRSEEHT